ncbi:MAG: phenylacetate--CoA ligase family protein, partial [Brevinematales bacterium]
VVTPIGVEGMPLVRFRTGDISYIINENCRCGRKTRRIAPVLGRKSQMLKYRGTVVFPNSIVSIVEANADFNGCYVEVYRAQFGEDRVVAVISAKGSKFDLEKLKEEFRAGLRVVPEIRIVDNGELVKITQPSGSRKRKIFFDMRRVENL